ncbi:MAG: NUDIX domain-containing protein [Candidatus Omnitrophota bacterium]
MPHDSIPQNKIDALQNIKSSKENILDGFYIFFSFDIANSTRYKTISKQSGPESWPVMMHRFYEYIANGLKKRLQDSINIWKFVGDEVLLYKKINKIEEAIKCIEISYSLMHDVINFLHNEFPDAKTHLSIKSVLWCADVKYVLPQNSEELKGPIKNIAILQESVNGLTKSVLLDFLGPDVDIGFRIAKCATQRRLVISSDLAYIITLKSKKLRNKLFIISYEPLKGIWDGRPYPIIWYEEDWSNIKDSFLYDEHYNNEFVKKIRENSYRFEPISCLVKVYNDLDRKDDMDELIQYLLKKSDTQSDHLEIPKAYSVEVHCVAVCFDKEGKILIAKRARDKNRFPNRWEFGCGQLAINETFEKCLSRNYKKDFGVELSFDDKLIPISSYIIEDNDRRKIPGVIFIAYVENPDKAERKSSSHSMIKWINSQNLYDLDDNECVPDFKDTARRAFEVWNKQKS